MSHRFKAIGFDWGGVLYIYSFKLYHTASEYLQLPLEQVREVYFKHNHLLNLAECDPKDFWKIVFTELGRGEETDKFMKYINNMPLGALNHPMFSLVELIKKRGFKVGLLSNMSSLGALEIRSHGVEKIFEVVFFSVEEQLMKPDPRVYQSFAKRLGVEPNELIFIDDSAKSLESAPEVGYTPVLYEDMPSLLNRLVELEVLKPEDLTTFITS
ncbi:MAG TPA: HAD-IA family hydrolase [Patescibacteria group bacterium]|nr:HAD-IA family hydrolase [Patescibacteria group bacterium]